MTVKDYFLDFVSYDTTSDDSTGSTPSTAKQKQLGAHLVEVMKSIGIVNAFMDDYGYVYGSIPANDERKTTVGYIAHMDTAPGISGKNVKPRVIENYNGKDIALNPDITMSPKSFPTLLSHTGKTLIVTDGTTLLGGDDKAGIAEILCAAEEIIRENPPHGAIKIGFTPDEEIGEGADHFDVKSFGCDYAYTVDGGEPAGILYENFNAAAAAVTVKGLSIHPGSAKGKLLNASAVAMEFCSMLPAEQVPEYTEGYEGFIHLDSVRGDVEEAVLKFIIRDHDKDLFARKKQLFKNAAEFLNKKYPTTPVTVEIRDSYYNMLEQILPHMQVIDKMKDAMLANGVTPVSVPIRGGTDGARLSYMGLPCPNIGTGGYNAHGRYEYVVLEEMETIKSIIKTAMCGAD